jgi:peptidoglycan/LPS O-acetylase OafA/YrhL
MSGPVGWLHDLIGGYGRSPESSTAAPRRQNADRSGGIDALRVLAAGMVFLYHAAPFGLALPLVGQAGREGVIVFFVISAYVLYRPMADESADLRRYAIRRATRIYPAYIVALAGSSLLSGIPLTPAYLVFGQTADLSHTTLLPVSWTLQVEVAFYLALPFLAALFRPLRFRAPALLLTSALLYVGVALVTPAAIETGPWSIAWFAWVFPLGMAAATIRRPTTWLLPVGAVALVGALALAWTQPLDAPMAIAGVLLVLGIRAIAVPRWLALSGSRLSYSFYLWHATLLTILANPLVALVATLAVSGMSWIAIERPSMA